MSYSSQLAAQRKAHKKQREARPLNGLGFFVARETRTVYHPITSAQDWDYDCRNRVYDPGRDRKHIDAVIKDNDDYLRYLGKQHRKDRRGGGVTVGR